MLLVRATKNCSPTHLVRQPYSGFLALPEKVIPRVLYYLSVKNYYCHMVFADLWCYPCNIFRSQHMLSGAWIWAIFLYWLSFRDGSWWYITLSPNTRGLYLQSYLKLSFWGNRALWQYMVSLWFLLTVLQGRMKESNRSSNVPRFVKRVELVQKQTIMHYQTQQSQPFLKIVVALPTMVASCRG
jgi:hypothetical protein